MMNIQFLSQAKTEITQDILSDLRCDPIPDTGSADSGENNSYRFVRMNVRNKRNP